MTDLCHEFGDVVDFVPDDDPAVFTAGVVGHLIQIVFRQMDPVGSWQ